MAKIKMSPLVSDIRNRMGDVVFSKWKGINYVREYEPPTDARSERQMKVRTTFKTLVVSWRALGSIIRESWNEHVKGQDMSGYNAFIGENYKAVNKEGAFILSKGIGEETAPEITAETGAIAGDITCTLESELPAGKHLTLFTHKKPNGSGMTSLTRHDMGSAITSPVKVSGLESGEEYLVHAIITDAAYHEASMVSPSMHVQATAK